MSSAATALRSDCLVDALPCAEERLVFHRTGDIRWQVRPELIGEEFLAEDGLRLHEYLREGLAEVVKTGSHRTVHRLTLSAGIYYLKHYRVTDWSGRLRNLVRPSKAACERTAALRAASLGIPAYAIDGIGFASRRGMTGDSYLLTPEIGNTVGLDDFLVARLPRIPEPDRSHLRRRSLAHIGELAARMHHGGLFHRDFHSENVLVRVEECDTNLWLIDMHPVAFSRPTAKRIESNLSLLANFPWQHLRAVDRLRFARAWWETFGRLVADDPRGPRMPYVAFREFVRRAGDRCYRGMLHASEIADRRWRRGNRKLLIADDGSVACRGVAELGRAMIERFRNDPESLFAGTSGDALDRNGTARVETTTCDVSGRALRCTIRATRFPVEAGASHLASVETPVRRAWEMGHAFFRRGLGAARPLSFVSLRKEHERHEYLLTEELAGAVPLATVLHADMEHVGRESQAAGVRSRAWWVLAARLLGARLRLMRDSRFVHGALDACNLLVSGEEGSPRLWFASLEFVKSKSGRFGSFRRDFERMLARLAGDVFDHPRITASLMLRCLKRIERDESDRSWKNTWRRISRTVTRNERRTGRGSRR